MLSQGACCLIFGPPGVGKSHLASAIGLALVENGCRALFARATDLVQRLQTARGIWRWRTCWPAWTGATC